MRKVIIMAGAAMLALAGCGDADGPEADSLELTYETPRFTDADRKSPVAAYVMANGATRAQISPDGAFMALSSNKSGEAQLYVGAADGTDLEQVTEGAGISFFDILPSGDILYGADNNGDERENYFLYDSETQESKLILPATEKGFRSYGGASGNGEAIAFASTERNGNDFDIYLMDLATGETRQVYEGRYGNFVEAVNDDASRLIISENVGEDSDKLYILNVASGERDALSVPKIRANHTNAGVFFTRFKTLIFATNRGGEFAEIEQFNLDEASDEEPKTLYKTDADVDALKLCGDQILFTVNRDGFSDLNIMRPGNPVRPVAELPRGVYAIDCNADTALVRVSGPGIPGDVYRFDLDNPKPVRVFASDLGKLKARKLISPEPIRMTARDGLSVQGLLYMPTETADPKPPVVFMVHGGPTAQARPSYSATVQYLVSRGIAVFQTNVRGSTGFGRTYTTLDDRRKRLDSIRDLVDMLESPELASRVDTDRAAVMGGSYGGYAVNAVLSEYPDAFIAGVSLFGVADWVTALEVASPALKAADLIEYGNIEEQEWRDFYTEQSPIRNANKIKVPVLYSHGAMDPRIDILETETMVAPSAPTVSAPPISASRMRGMGGGSWTTSFIIKDGRRNSLKRFSALSRPHRRCHSRQQRNFAQQFWFAGVGVLSREDRYLSECVLFETAAIRSSIGKSHISYR